MIKLSISFAIILYFTVVLERFMILKVISQRRYNIMRHLFKLGNNYLEKNIKTLLLHIISN